jgi:hypothetical protein
MSAARRPPRVSLPADLSSALPDGAALARTAETIAACQLPNGMIPWFEGGHADPWNHVEAAMALGAAGRLEAAARAFEWLAATQHWDGSWHAYYLGDEVEDARVDTNVCAYVATGVWHHYLASGDRGFLEELWPVVRRAIEFVARHERPEGGVTWSVDADGTPGRYALLTGSSSIYFSLRCAISVAEELGLERPDWELFAGRLRHAVACRPGAFEPKERFAMDWYYPVLVGALDRPAALERLAERWGELVIEGRGVRCVADQPWVTTAETAECALALLGVGQQDLATALLAWVQDQRQEDGSYTTGVVYPQRRSFPGGERTTYSAAAIVLALSALRGEGEAAGLFVSDSLPKGLDLGAEEALEGRP